MALQVLPARQEDPGKFAGSRAQRSCAQTCCSSANVSFPAAAGSLWTECKVGLQVEGLLQRLHGAMPWLSVLGGIGYAPAWGERSLRGALFLGDRAYDSGAVGVLMSGPLQASNCMCTAVCTSLLPTRFHQLTVLGLSMAEHDNMHYRRVSDIPTPAPCCADLKLWSSKRVSVILTLSPILTASACGPGSA